MTIDDSSGELARCRAALGEMAAQLSRAEDEERTRIARGVHDDLGQVLVAAQMRVADLERTDTDPATKTLIRQVGELVQQAIETARSLTFELLTPLLAAAGIEAELEHLTDRLTEEHHIRYRFDSDSQPKPMSQAVAEALLRATHELLMNVKKHSQARMASVVATGNGNRIQVTVSDDGIGFEPSPPGAPEKAGFGLLIVRTRLAEIGGDVAIETEPGSGTRIVMTAPLLAIT